MKGRWRWVAPFAPVVLLFIVSLLLGSNAKLNRVLYVRGDLSTLALIAGLGAAMVMVIALLVWEWVERVRQQTIAEQQQQAAQDRRRFLRRLDHELKNPLTAMRVGLANAAEAPTERLRREALVSVEDQAMRLSRLVSELRKLADMERHTFEAGPVELALLLREVLLAAQERPEAKERQLIFTMPQAPRPLPTITGDWDLLFLAIYNLLDNALKFTRPGDRVELRAFETRSMAVIEVIDTGVGIPEAELPHVWEELYRGERARGTQGSGLGLALVRAVVERHSGQVKLRSRVGEGTVFSIRLPTASALERLGR